jgi:hypothetical protein
MCSLGPELQACMMLTRFRKQDPAAAAEPQTLTPSNHCFLSVPPGQPPGH